MLAFRTERFYRALHWKDIEEIQSEIRTIMKENQGRTIEMGFGKNLATYPRTLSRTLLVFAGHPYSIDSAPAMETNKWNIPLPEETLSMLRHCKTDLWLIPVGEQPFTMIGYYGELAPGSGIRRCFQRRVWEGKILQIFRYLGLQKVSW